MDLQISARHTNSDVLETQPHGRPIAARKPSAAYTRATALLTSTTMPPHLHPRSRWTTSLFTTTLLASFLVVGMPHILPCPAPRTDFADAGNLGDGQRRRRRKRAAVEATDTDERIGESTTEELLDEGAAMARKTRECPVPKPGGLIGEVLGFKKTEEGNTPQVRVETVGVRSTSATKE